MMEPDYTADLRRFVDALAPTSALCIGPDCEAVFGARAGLVKLAAGSGLPARIAHYGRFDFALLFRTIEYLEREEALALLAQLRDCQSGRLGVLVPIGDWPGHVSEWNNNDLLGLGFVVQRSYPRPHGQLRFYLFDISSYKQTPDWFNADYWAHPDRWDKEWW